jgi:hypothetical protein
MSFKRVRRYVGADPDHPAWLRWMENLPASPSLKRALDDADAELRTTMERQRNTEGDQADEEAEGMD